MKYSLYKNIKYVYNHAFRINKKLRIVIPLHIIGAILIPFIGILIPSIAVAFITENYTNINAHIGNFLLVIGIIFIFYTSILFSNKFLSVYIDIENIAARMLSFYHDLGMKLMKTDYINVEPQEKQVIIQKALYSINSNWVGLELMLKNTPAFMINFLGLLIYSTFISWLNLAIIIVLVLMSVLNYLLNLYAQKYEKKHRKKYAKLDRQITYLYDNSTSLINGKDVRIYKMKTWFYQVFKTLIKKRINWTKRVEYRYFLPSLSDNILLLVRDFIAYGILINLLLDGKISPATFTLYVGIIGGFSTWLNSSVTAFSNLKRANIGVNDFRNFIEIDEVFNHREGALAPTKADFPLEIEFKNVSFRYPSADKDTLKNINFKINRGSKIALVGNNGAGKTTLVKLLTGLYHPTEGEILVNGTPIKDYNLDEYQKLIGAVFQDVLTLAFTIEKNIAGMKTNEIDSERVWKSLRLAGLDEKVKSLKHQEKTYLTQTMNKEGIQLSGGEMQKMMLAKALYKDAPIMVLDEPTAALDPIAEAELYEKYNDLTKEKTSLFISHRLASTKFCDRILFLDSGRIIEDGTHSDLIKLDGKYAEMFEIQSHYYKENLKEMENE